MDSDEQQLQRFVWGLSSFMQQVLAVLLFGLSLWWLERRQEWCQDCEDSCRVFGFLFGCVSDTLVERIGIEKGLGE